MYYRGCWGTSELQIPKNNYDIFNKYNMNKIEFRAYLDNPVIKHYYKFTEKFGGRLVGILKDTIMLEDGKLHNEVMFEMFKKDYNLKKNNRVPK